MRRYFYGDWIFDEDYSCEVVEIWEYNTQLDDKWELIEVYPLNKDYEDSEFNNAGNLTPDDEGYVFSEITKDNFKDLKEDYTIYNELLSLIGREFDNHPGIEKVPVDMYVYKTGEFVRGFKSLSDAASYMGCTVECIRLAVKKGNPILNSGYCFKKR